MLRQLREKVEKTCHIYHLYYYLTNMSLFISMHLILPLSLDMSWEIISELDSFFFQKHITKKYLVIDIFKYIYVLLKSSQNYQQSKYHP